MNFVAANRCPPVPHIESATASSFLANHGAIVTYTCDVGMLFSPINVTAINVTCSENSQWVGLEHETKCQGQ